MRPGVHRRDLELPSRNLREVSANNTTIEGKHLVNQKKFDMDVATTFAVVVIVSLVVSYLYGLIVHGAGLFEWESSFRFAIILCIVLP
jgi:hypothetical protein